LKYDYFTVPLGYYFLTMIQPILHIRYKILRCWNRAVATCF